MAGDERPPKRQRLENGMVLCNFGGCCKEFSPKSVVAHERTHSGSKPYKCDVPDCGEAFTVSQSLVYHKRIHDNVRPFICTAENCEARFVKSNDLKAHFERNHSEWARQRRKKREERLYKFLRSVGYSPDRETIVQFCGQGSKKLARIDFIIYKTDRVVAVECDEREHDREPVLCEMTRMLDVAAQHRLTSDLPLHFVRFNPDGYVVDGRAQKPKMAERHRELLLAIEEPLTAPLAITYICYSSTGGVADVTRSDDFPQDLRESCKTRLA
jgi:hypothetical protein